MSGVKVKELLRKAETLKSKRANFETEWQNVADIFRPIKADITVSRTEGDKSHIKKLYESFPIVAVSTLKSIVIGVFFNRSIKPFSIVSPDEDINDDSEVSVWLSNFTDMMLGKMFNPLSGFERAFSEATSDDITFGTMATFIEKGSKSILKYHTLNIKDFLIAESRDGDVDYVVIKSKKSARQIIQEWGDGRGKIHENIIKASEKDPFKEFDIQLHIFPREERDKQKIDLANKPIAGVWIDEKHGEIIQEIGWDVMPVAVGRSEKSSGEDYGTSRAMIALADGRQINQMSKDSNLARELALRPPLAINANFNKRINLSPTALNYPDQKSLANGRPSVEQMITVGNIGAVDTDLARKENNIREAFFLDKLKVFDNPNATATQVLELRAESFRVMGDFILSLIEYMDQVLDTTFDILFREIYDVNNNFALLPNKLFQDDFPEALKGNPDLKVNYINPITQSQQLSESATIDKFIADAANAAQINPEILDLINMDEALRKKGQILNIDPEIINSKAKVKTTRDNRQAQADQEQETQNLERTLEGADRQLFESENGKVVLDDLQNILIKRMPFFAEDITTDALLREGARHLLNHIHYQLGKD
jgi:hypothetical protein